MSTDARKTIGRRGEQLAAEHFERLGWAILARNHHTRFGELDIVALDGETLVFAEVKTCRLGKGQPWASLHERKRSQVRRMAQVWLHDGGATAAVLAAALRRGRRRARRPRRPGPARPPAGGVLMSLARVNSFTLDGVAARRVWVEADVRKAGLPAFAVVGLADKAVREARERVRAAITNAGYVFPDGRITVNLAPAYLRKIGPAFDLPLAVAIIAAGGELGAESLVEHRDRGRAVAQRRRAGDPRRAGDRGGDARPRHPAPRRPA